MITGREMTKAILVLLAFPMTVWLYGVWASWPRKGDK